MAHYIRVFGVLQLKCSFQIENTCYSNILVEIIFLNNLQGPALYAGQTTIADENRQKLYEAVGFLNKFLDGKQYITGSEQPTLADLSIFSSITNISVT